MNQTDIWVEKYRPTNIQDIVMRESIKKTAEHIVSYGEIPNMIFAGSSGTGKTTLAKALCKQLDLDCIMINASEDSGIDTLRVTIRNFASTSSLTSERVKVVILDEADYLNANSTQPALRGFIEEFHTNCRFILTCNHPNRIIDAIRSRCDVLDFTIPESERAELIKDAARKIARILQQEQVNFEPHPLMGVVKDTFPDMRKTLLTLQRYSRVNGGKIDSGILAFGQTKAETDQLAEFIKAKNFRECRTWVAQNGKQDMDRIYSSLYASLLDTLEKKSIPDMIVILANYQYQSAFVADKELTLTAAIVEIIKTCVA